jgi:antitoxin component YwqK of YwqJK toxin-antitoxin module
MAMDILVQRAPGRNSFLILFLLVFLISCGDEQSSHVYLNANEVNLRTSKGISYVKEIPVTATIFRLNENGDTVAIVPYTNGKEHGWSRYYFSKGKLAAARLHVDGWKQGEHTGWFENGQKHFVYHFSDDRFDGNQKEWLENGQLYSDLNYENGIENGSQKVWYANGKIKTNYQIINNRRYGLLGTKNCVNAVDSVFKR